MLEAADQIQQVLRVGFVERCGRLVQDQQFDGLVEGLGDLDQLLLADAQFFHGGTGVFRQTASGQQFQSSQTRFTPVDHTEMGGLVAQEDVLGDRQLRNEGKLLMDDDNAGVFTGPDIFELNILALKRDVAAVGSERMHSGQNFHQGGLPGAVLAADGMNLAAADSELHRRQCLDAREFFGDATHLKDAVAVQRPCHLRETSLSTCGMAEPANPIRPAGETDRGTQMTRSLPPSTGICAPVVRPKAGLNTAQTPAATSSWEISAFIRFLVLYSWTVMP